MSPDVLTGNKASDRLVELIKQCNKLHVAVAWATPNTVADEILKAHKKWGHIVIGTHMFQTAPDLLRRFMKFGNVRIREPEGKLFHPKVYFFEMPTGVCIVVGSHNLTGGAFDNGNIEISLLYSGQAKDETALKVMRFIASAWKDAKEIDEDFLHNYEPRYRWQQQRQSQDFPYYKLASPQKNQSKYQPLDMAWKEYVAAVKNDENHKLTGRIAILERAAHLFLEKDSLIYMEPDERRAIAGTFGHKEETFEGLSWAWFGTMFPFGDFKNLINQSPNGLSRALDHIPYRGEVKEEHFSAFADSFIAAFEGKSHKGGVAAASRLLALKRPDVFVAVNNANRDGLCEAFGAAHSTLKLDNYWERIIVPILLSPWWQEARPDQRLNGRIWDCRAALLDCIYYDPEKMGHQMAG